MTFICVCMRAPACLFLPKQKFPAISLVSGSNNPATRRLRIPQNCIKEKKRSIWYFSGNLICHGRLQQCVVSSLCLEDWFGKREGSGIIVCIYVCAYVWMGEAVIILVCTVESAEVQLWHATLLHSICSNPNKSSPGAHKAIQALLDHKRL